MLGGADNPNGELPSYITGANKISQLSFVSIYISPDILFAEQ